MKKLKIYSYTVLLMVSVCIVSPIIFKQIWESSKPTLDNTVIETDAPANESSIITNTEPTTTQSEVLNNNNIAETTAAVTSTDVSDVPIVTTTTEPVSVFKKGDPTYFDDALFIGDSRTVGLSEYGTLKNADYFSNTGMSVYNLNKASDSIDGVGKISLEKLLSSKKYGKIYLMLGINELGYNFNSTVKKYGEWIEYFHEKQPDALIFIEANLHVTKERSDTDTLINNSNIDKFNSEIEKLADNKSVFYIDINEYFDDDKGNLPSEYTSDTTHVFAKYYSEWCDWLCTKTVNNTSNET